MCAQQHTDVLPAAVNENRSVSSSFRAVFFQQAGAGAAAPLAEAHRPSTQQSAQNGAHRPVPGRRSLSSSPKPVQQQQMDKEVSLLCFCPPVDYSFARWPPLCFRCHLFSFCTFP